MFILADFYYSKGKTKSAQTVLSDILRISELSENYRQQVQELTSYYTFINQIMLDTGKNILELDSVSIATLQNYEDMGGIVGDKARALLLVNNASDYIEPVYKPQLVLSTKFSVDDKNYNEYFEKDFKLYPNPASDYFYVEYKLPEICEVTQLVITDALGKIIYQKELFTLQDILIINIDDFIDGTYNCSIFTGERRLFNKKIIIKR